MRKKLYFLVPVIMLFAAFTSFSSAQISRKTDAKKVRSNQENAVAWLRNFYFKHDYEGGYLAGQKLVEQFPENVELQAWFILNMERSSTNLEATVALAKNLAEEYNENAYAYFALADAMQNENKEENALAASEKAVSLNPTDEYIILQHAQLLAKKGAKSKTALDFLEKNKSSIKNQSNFLTAKAWLLILHAFFNNGNKNEFADSFALLEQARKLNPQNLDAYYAGALYQQTLPINQYSLYKQAVENSPYSITVRETFWQAILKGQPEKSISQREDEVVADAAKFIRLRPNSAQALITAIKQFDEMQMPAEKKFYENLFFKKHPGDIWTESYLKTQIWKLLDQSGDNSELKPQLVKMLWNFVNRPVHFDKQLLGGVYRTLFLQIRDDQNVSDKTMTQVISRMIELNKSPYAFLYSDAAETLLVRKMFDKAEEFARLGVSEVEKKFAERQKLDGNKQSFQSDFNRQMSKSLTALGEVLIKREKYDEAETQLLKAKNLAIDNESKRLILENLGDAYAARKEFNKAESAYLDAYAFNTEKNERYGRIKQLYEKRNENSVGYANYLTKAKADILKRRKEIIVAARIENPQILAGFNLKTINGKTLSFEELHGKVLVINIWGTWCAPCVGEMPQFQELYKKFAADAEVAILTINTDDTAEKVIKFMTDKKYDFPVLLGGDYINNAGSISRFPTTWFVSKQGRIVYIKQGDTEKLFDEFSWRIEALKENK